MRVCMCMCTRVCLRLCLCLCLCLYILFTGCLLLETLTTALHTDRHGGGNRSNPPPQDVVNITTLGFRNQGYGNALRSLDNGIRNVTNALKSEG